MKCDNHNTTEKYCPNCGKINATPQKAEKLAHMRHVLMEAAKNRRGDLSGLALTLVMDTTLGWALGELSDETLQTLIEKTK